MKAAIYNPYLDTLGGGERYSLSVASILKTHGYDVFVQWKDPLIKEKLERRFGIDLSGVNFIQDIKRGDGYDVCFWVSDGSIPTLKSRKNLLHFQVPFTNLKANTLINKMKLIRINKILCNSFFTKRFIDKEFGVKSGVLYPPVDVNEIKPMKKLNQILFVGRFSQLKQVKNHEVLINCFKKLYDSGFDRLRLILAGGTEVGVGDYLEKLKEKSQGYPIEFIENADFDKIKKLYSKSKLFWSAVGYEQDEEKDPDRVEHFGISVVEAMAGGSVPLIYNAGGHKEIVNDGINGFVWSKTNDLINLSKKVFRDSNLFQQVSENAIKRSRHFSYEKFTERLLEII